MLLLLDSFSFAGFVRLAIGLWSGVEARLGKTPHPGSLHLIHWPLALCASLGGMVCREGGACGPLGPALADFLLPSHPAGPHRQACSSARYHTLVVMAGRSAASCLNTLPRPPAMLTLPSLWFFNFDFRLPTPTAPCKEPTRADNGRQPTTLPIHRLGSLAHSHQTPISFHFAGDVVRPPPTQASLPPATSIPP